MLCPFAHQKPPQCHKTAVTVLISMAVCLVVLNVAAVWQTKIKIGNSNNELGKANDLFHTNIAFSLQSIHNEVMELKKEISDARKK